MAPLSIASDTDCFAPDAQPFDPPSGCRLLPKCASTLGACAAAARGERSPLLRHRGGVIVPIMQGVLWGLFFRWAAKAIRGDSVKRVIATTDAAAMYNPVSSAILAPNGMLYTAGMIGRSPETGQMLPAFGEPKSTT